MIKKHLIPSAVIAVFIVMVNVFVYTAVSTAPKSTESFNKNNTTAKNIKKPIGVTKKPALKLKDLQFAKETLPNGDAKVKKKMKKALASFSYKKLQTNRLHKKAEAWFPIVEPILAAHGIPNDFKYMPLVESGLASGTSPRGAAGYWQFMPSTARHYGLIVNGKVDERNNLRKSTVAACKYLKELYQIFNSWTLAAAAYNMGETHLLKQINRQNEDNYYRMKLNKETSKYVYKLISVKEVLENPVRNGYEQERPLLAYDAQNEQQEALKE